MYSGHARCFPKCEANITSINLCSNISCESYNITRTGLLGNIWVEIFFYTDALSKSIVKCNECKCFYPQVRHWVVCISYSLYVVASWPTYNRSLHIVSGWDTWQVECVRVCLRVMVDLLLFLCILFHHLCMESRFPRNS